MKEVSLKEMHELIGEAIAATELAMQDAQSRGDKVIEADLEELLDVILSAARISSRVIGEDV